MLGIIYCLLAILIGKEVAGMFFVSGNRNKSTRTNQFWILASGALGTGLLIFGWITYMISWGGKRTWSGETTYLWKSGSDGRSGCFSGPSVRQTLSKREF